MWSFLASGCRTAGYLCLYWHHVPKSPANLILVFQRDFSFLNIHGIRRPRDSANCEALSHKMTAKLPKS